MFIRIFGCRSAAKPNSFFRAETERGRVARQGPFLGHSLPSGNRFRDVFDEWPVKSRFVDSAIEPAPRYLARTG